MSQPIPQMPVTGTAAELANFRPARGQMAHATDSGDWFVGDGLALVSALVAQTPWQAAITALAARVTALETP